MTNCKNFALNGDQRAKTFDGNQLVLDVNQFHFRKHKFQMIAWPKAADVNTNSFLRGRSFNTFNF